jgi:DNA-binding transcriptional regulator GbsR (MarR family)
MKQKIQDKILKLDCEIQEIINNLAQTLSEYADIMKTDKELEHFRKLNQILKRIKEL